jgi:hypothetical protein
VRIANDGNLFSLSRTSGSVPGDENVFNIQAVQGKIRVVYESENDSLDFSPDEDGYVRNDWAIILVCVQFRENDEESNLAIRNHAALIGETTFIGAFIDDSDFAHILGAEKNISGVSIVDGGFYSGFMWDFCLFAAYITNFDNVIGPDCSAEFPDLCSVCPVEPCLIDCELDQYWTEQGGC